MAITSALRVDDAVYRMTRDRAVIFLSDVSRATGEEIVQRNLARFGEEFAAAEGPKVELGFFEVTPASGEVTVKQVLPALFAGIDEA